MIDFGGGRRISTVVISTACGYDGRGIFPYTTRRDYGDMIRAANATGTTRFSKSMTRHRRSGNFHLWRPWTWKYIQNLGGDGMLNAYGLTNRGVEKHSREIGRAIADGVQVIPNFSPDFAKGTNVAAEETLEAIDILGDQIRHPEDFWAVEINLSCPNIKDYCIADNVKDALFCIWRVRKSFPDLIIIAKISVVHPPHFVKDLRDAGANVVHSANTVPYNMLFKDTSPLQKVGGGGVSGGPAFEMAAGYNSRVIDYFDGPVILGCGIVDDEKLEFYLDLLGEKCPDGNWSVSVCTAALQRPDWIKEIIQCYNV